jgi:inner membrane protein
VILLPTTARYSANVRTEQRSRGIFDVTVYTADLTLIADFEPADIAKATPAGATLLWSGAVAVVGLSDVRGMQQNAGLAIDGRNVPFAPGAGPPGADAKFTAIHAPLGLTAAPERLSLQTTFALRGSSELAFVPAGNDTTVDVQSAWPDPSFFGAFLPTARRVDVGGFGATWSVPYLARGFGQVFYEASDLVKIQETRLGVQFYQSISFYQLVARSLKYAVLFVGLTFLAYFAVELVTGARLHAVQYALIGAAQVLFYLLLLSISEHIGFDPAYMIAATSTVTLTTAYSISALGSRGRADSVCRLKCALRRAPFAAAGGRLCAPARLAPAVRDPGAGDVPRQKPQLASRGASAGGGVRSDFPDGRHFAIHIR